MEQWVIFLMRKRSEKCLFLQTFKKLLENEINRLAIFRPLS
jgi:hypothetical protein